MLCEKALRGFVAARPLKPRSLSTLNNHAIIIKPTLTRRTPSPPPTAQIIQKFNPKTKKGAYNLCRLDGIELHEGASLDSLLRCGGGVR